MKQKEGGHEWAAKSWKKKQEKPKKTSTTAKEKGTEKELEGSPQAYAAQSSLNRAVNRINSHLPKSPRKVIAMVKEFPCNIKLNFPKKKVPDQKAINWRYGRSKEWFKNTKIKMKLVDGLLKKHNMWKLMIKMGKGLNNKNGI